MRRFAGYRRFRIRFFTLPGEFLWLDHMEVHPDHLVLDGSRKLRWEVPRSRVESIRFERCWFITPPIIPGWRYDLRVVVRDSGALERERFTPLRARSMRTHLRSEGWPVINTRPVWLGNDIQD